MKKPKKRDEQDVMHVKNKTKGTSNEISFSVLHNLREKRVEKREAKNRDENNILWTKGGSKTSPYKVVSGDSADADFLMFGNKKAPAQGLHTTTNGSIVENSLVKKRRFTRYVRNGVKITLITLIALAVLALAGFGTKGYLDSVRLETGEVNSLIANLETTDDYLLKLDNATSESVKVSSPGELEFLETNREATINTLTNIKNFAINGAEETTVRENKYLLQSIIDSTTEKIKMIETGISIANAKKEINDLDLKINELLQEITIADGIGKEAALIVSEGSPGSFESARNIDTQAKDAFVGLAEQVKADQEHYATLDFSGIIEYLDLKIAAYENAILSDESLMNQNIADAERYNGIYEGYDLEAAALANNLAVYKDDIVAEFSAELEQLEQEYASCKANASVADEHIRSYLDKK